MSKQHIKKTTPPLEERVAKIERTLESITTQDQAVTPQQLDPKFEAEQEAHQEALASLQTKRKGKMVLSLNSATPPAEVEARLKELEKDEGA